MDSQEFIQAGQKLLDYIVTYRNNMKSRKINVLPDLRLIQPGFLCDLLPNTAPEHPEAFDLIIKDIDEKIMPGITHWQHPDFHAYYPTSSTYPSMLAELMKSAYGCIGFSWLSCPAMTELEVITLDWLAYALGLPKQFLSHFSSNDPDHKGGGMIEVSASLGCVTLMMGLRERMLEKIMGENYNFDDEARLNNRGPGIILDRLIAYTSDQAHSSVTRAFNVAMIKYRTVPCQRLGKHLIFDLVNLKKMIIEDKAKGFIPLVCVATSGTTSTCEFEDIEGIGQICKEFNIWLHIDGAYGGSVLLCSEFRHLMKGLEYADSIIINGHKMLLMNFDCTFVWLKDHTVITNAFRSDPTYLRHSFHGMPDYRNWSLTLGRSFRALKVWFVLRTYGLKKIRNLIRLHSQLAKEFEKLLLHDQRFEIVNDVQYGLVCFRIKNDDNQLTRILHEKLLKQSHIYLVMSNLMNYENQHMEYANSFKNEQIDFLRFVCIHGCTMEDVQYAYEKIASTTSYILQNSIEKK